MMLMFPLSLTDEYVWTENFDVECHKIALKRANLSSNSSGSSEDEDLWSSNDSFSSATTVEPSPYDVPKLEANLYYAGVGPQGHGPKLIYRTSKDVFKEPSGPEAYKRLMRVIAVPGNHEFGPNVTWDVIRDQVRGLVRRIVFSRSFFFLFSMTNRDLSP